MKKKTKKKNRQGFDSLIGQRVLVFCMNYIYTGKLTSVNDESVELSDAAIVYETGAFDSNKFVDAQKLGMPLFIQKSAIESYHPTRKL